MSDIASERKRIYQGVYLDVKEDVNEAARLGRQADRAMRTVDSETVALFAKYGVLDKLPERLHLAPQDKWKKTVARKTPGDAGAPRVREESRTVVREWARRLVNYR